MDKRQFCRVLSQIEQLQRILIEYSGSGDSGSIDQVYLYDKSNDDIDIEESQLRDIENFAYDILEEKHPGWEINDGASGSISIDVPDRKIYIDHNEYYQESNNTNSVMDF